MKKKRNKHEESSPAEPRETAANTEETASAPDATPSNGAPAPESGEPETVPLERLLRLQADFDNYRKRTARERAAMADRAAEDLIRELLPVLDNFDIALQHAAEESADTSMVEGFRIVAEQLETVLRKCGLQPVPTDNVPFDPHQHEAVAHLPDPVCPEGMIISRTRRGFRLGNQLLRAAQVVVSSGPPPSEPDGAAAADSALQEE